MEAHIRKGYLESAKDLKAHLSSETYRAMNPERAFIEWYIAARFGKIGDDSYEIVDGQNDGGIDAIVRTVNGIFILQMKYEVIPRIGTVKRDEIAGFEKVAKYFINAKEEAQFNKWIESVRGDLKHKYKDIYRLIRRDKNEVRFIFVTTKSFEFLEGEDVEVEDVQNILSLWNLYSEGFTPPTEQIQLKLTGTWHSKDNDEFENYVGLANTQDFIKLMNQDRNERLFAQNVRTDLATKLNAMIRHTYEKDPDKFWLGNNGIYIVCRKVVASGDSFTLTYPSVINGSQTLHAIYKSNISHPCKILVRILCMDVTGNPKLLGEVIRRTNSQNAMNAINLCSHDPYQLHIALCLDRYNIFYERREKEWKNEKSALLSNYYPVTIKEIGQWLSTLNAEIGFGTARSNLRELFENQKYEDIFGAFVDQKFSKKPYKDLILVTWSGLFIKILIKHLPKTKRGDAKMCHLLLAKAVYDSIEELYPEVEKMLQSHRFGRKKIPSKIISKFSRMVTEFEKLQKKNQEIEENIDFSNYFKRDDLTEYAYNKVINRTTQKDLQKLFSNEISNIN